MVFSAHGLLKEYGEPVNILRDGRVQQVAPLTETETIELPGVGTLEAFLTSGSTSTCPWTYEETLHAYEVKTLRYPGHCDKIRVLRQLGFLATESVAVDGVEVSPRALSGALFERRLTFRDSPDLAVMRVECVGATERVVIDWLERPDPETGFTAMERCTGFSAAIVATMQAQGVITPGAHRHEVGVPAEAFVEGLRVRGFHLAIQGPTPVGAVARR